MRLPNLNFPLWCKLLLCFGAIVPEVLIPGAGALALFGVCALTLLISREARQATLRWVPRRALDEVAIGVGAGIAIGMLGMFAIDPLAQQWTGSRIDLSNFKGVEGNLPNTLILLAVGWVVGGFAEEVSHRGFLIGWGSKLLGGRSTVPLALMTSAVFGAAHLYQGPAGAISTGLTGLLLALLYIRRDKTLVAPIIAHGTIDTIGILALYLGYGL